jgi:hypothetical protein
MSKIDINPSWYPHKVSNYNIIGNYETVDVLFSWECDGPLYHVFGIVWTRKCFRNDGGMWRSVVDGSASYHQDTIRWKVDELKKSIEENNVANQLADKFMEDMNTHLDGRLELKDA